MATIDKAGYAENSIVSFKLVSGDEMVALVVQDRTDCFVLSKPLTVVPTPNGIGLAPSMMSINVDDNIQLPKAYVIISNPTVDQVADYYRKATTGVEVVRKPGILLG